jgi:phenylpyruvate tautomerase PptA (4-oxalocrotonate tautomerase family)
VGAPNLNVGLYSPHRTAKHEAIPNSFLGVDEYRSKNAEWSRNMPLYECVTTVGKLIEDQREQIADAITQAHCELTGAPVELVHVIFSDIPRPEIPTAAVSGLRQP